MSPVWCRMCLVFFSSALAKYCLVQNTVLSSFLFSQQNVRVRVCVNITLTLIRGWGCLIPNPNPQMNGGQTPPLLFIYCNHGVWIKYWVFLIQNLNSIFIFRGEVSSPSLPPSLKSTYLALPCNSLYLISTKIHSIHSLMRNTLLNFKISALDLPKRYMTSR